MPPPPVGASEHLRTGSGASAVLEQLDAFAHRVPGAKAGRAVGYAEGDLPTVRLRYACSGHLRPLRLAPDGHPDFLWGGSSLLLDVANGMRRRPEAQTPM